MVLALKFQNLNFSKSSVMPRLAIFLCVFLVGLNLIIPPTDTTFLLAKMSLKKILLWKKLCKLPQFKAHPICGGRPITTTATTVPTTTTATTVPTTTMTATTVPTATTTATTVPTTTAITETTTTTTTTPTTTAALTASASVETTTTVAPSDSTDDYYYYYYYYYNSE